MKVSIQKVIHRKREKLLKKENNKTDLSKKAFGCDAQHVRSASLDDLPEACSEWTPHF